jgi:DNA-binding SARP family transcriptional activator
VTEQQHTWELSLLGGFGARRSGQAVPVSTTGARLLAFLALRGRPATRRTVAATLWPEKLGERAVGNLRSVIWRLPTGLVETNGTHLMVGQGVRCDVVDFTLRVRQLIDGVPPPAPADLDYALYERDLLPTWSEDWVAIERERIRQLRIHALDTLSMRLTNAGRYCEAITVGLAAVAAEPLRESAHRTVITAHLAEGNHAEALKHYDAFRKRLAAELGLDPSPQLGELIRDITRR